MVAASPTHTDIANWPFPFSRQDWDHTPSAVQDALLALHNQLAELQQQYFTLQQQVDLPPALPYASSDRAAAHRDRDHAFVLHQARCGGCGRLRKAAVPGEHLSGYGPRLTALIGELAGMRGTSRRLMQDFCHAVLHVPISLGAVQKVVDRVSHALVPHYEAIAALARQATVATSTKPRGFCHNTLQWLWAMTTEKGSLFLVHPNRSKDAFFALIEDRTGILVSDGYGVSGAPSSTAGRHG